jgi:LytR cell envelope-related transcriptional attenuator
MDRPSGRRPLPAVAFLVGLLLLTALVWWRVIHRTDNADAAHTAGPNCTTSPPASSASVPAPADVSVQVLNSTQRAGLASSVSKALTKDGFKPAGTPANDSTTHPPVAGVAEIRFGPTGKAAATLLSFYLPGAALAPDQRANGTVDVALGAKFTALATPTAVTKALISAKLTQESPSRTAAATPSTPRC